jgi:hypothetical protein
MLGWDTRQDRKHLAWVNRYDWGYHFYGADDPARTLADIDPESGWHAAIERSKRLRQVQKYCGKGHPDSDRWDRIEKFRYHRIFLLDANKTPEVIKLLAR